MIVIKKVKCREVQEICPHTRDPRNPANGLDPTAVTHTSPAEGLKSKAVASTSPASSLEPMALSHACPKQGTAPVRPKDQWWKP